MTDDADRFWTWSLKAYGAPRVADLCLDMQDTFGANVNMVLACAWAADDQGLELRPEDIRAMLIGLAPWSASVTQPLRAARKALKTAPAPATGQGDSNLRGLVKDAELKAERLEQTYLAGALRTLTGGATQDSAAKSPSSSPKAEKALMNLEAYGKLLHINADSSEWTRTCRDLVRELFTRIG